MTRALPSRTGPTLGLAVLAVALSLASAAGAEGRGKESSWPEGLFFSAELSESVTVRTERRDRSPTRPKVAHGTVVQNRHQAKLLLQYESINLFKSILEPKPLRILVGTLVVATS